MCMQPKLCTKCKKNIAVVFITKMENGVTMNEGYCLKCARGLGVPQIDQTIKQMGISEEDLDMLTDEMSNVFGQLDPDEQDDDEIDSQTATFPLLNQLFGGNMPMPQMPQPLRKEKKEEPAEEGKGKKKNKKHKFLDSYCMDLTGRARAGKLDKVKVKFQDAYSACVVMSSGGYPSAYEKGKLISGLEEAEKFGTVYHAGTKRNADGSFVTSGGRVLCVSATGRSLRQALRNCYRGVDTIKFEGAFYRKDIGSKDSALVKED